MHAVIAVIAVIPVIASTATVTCAIAWTVTAAPAAKKGSSIS